MGSTHKNTWKQFERAVAAIFGAKRTPLSGGNSGITRSDTRHPDLFIEAKLRQSFSLWKLYEETRKLAKLEEKIPIVAIKEKGKTGFLLLLSPNDLKQVADRLIENGIKTEEPTESSGRNELEEASVVHNRVRSRRERNSTESRGGGSSEPSDESSSHSKRPLRTKRIRL